MTDSLVFSGKHLFWVKGQECKKDPQKNPKKFIKILPKICIHSNRIVLLSDCQELHIFRIFRKNRHFCEISTFFPGISLMLRQFLQKPKIMREYLNFPDFQKFPKIANWDIWGQISKLYLNLGKSPYFLTQKSDLANFPVFSLFSACQRAFL